MNDEHDSGDSDGGGGGGGGGGGKSGWSFAFIIPVITIPLAGGCSIM